MPRLAVLLLAAAPALACARRHEDPPTAAPVDAGETVLRVEDDGKTVDVAQGSTVVARLRLNAGTGYSWTASSSDAGVLEAHGERTSEQASTSSMPGAPRFDVYRFAAKATGRADLSFELRRPWEQDAAATRSVHVTVRVH